ncbi:MAG: hypothetical protein ACRDKY_04610 [Solirubrobacteraceae bacterium]
MQDRDTGFERELRRRGMEQIGAWGLHIVDIASSRWGVFEGTSHVCFDLELP